MYTGQAAIKYLASVVNKVDPGASSHWQKFHSSFRFVGDRFEGLQGFGGCGRPYYGLRKLAHRFLQRRFRRMGVELPQFMAIDSLAKEMTSKQCRCYDLDVLRQSLTLAFLTEHLPESVLSPSSTVCVIGDGFASMTTLLLASGSAGVIVLVNLSKTLLVDLWYLKLWMGSKNYEKSVKLVTDQDGLACALDRANSNKDGRGHVVAIQASDHELLRDCPVDIVFNTVSMQEMDPSVIDDYFKDLRFIASKRKIFFYCCNREEKELPDGTMTRFLEYPWQDNDQILIDELCPWHQEYYSLMPPFYRPYDGPIRHRLTILS